MSVISFLNDLGIISNKDTPAEQNPNLLQGQELMEFERGYIKDAIPHLELLQITSNPKISSIIEMLDNDDSTAVTTQNVASDVSKLEDEFNKTLIEYTNTYKELSESLLKKNQTQKDVYQYYNKVLTSDDGNYVYVNNYGYTHRYSTDAWTNNSNSCPSDPQNVTSDDLANLKLQGPDMGSGQACLVAGTNIQNKDTKEIAWVDIKGYKHIYSDDMWKGKDDTCNIKPTQITSDEYDAIPSGSNMTTTTVCDKLDIDPQTWHQLSKLNEKLISLARALSKDLDSLIVTDAELKGELNEQQEKLNTYIDTLDYDQTQMNQANNKFYTIEGEEENTSLMMTSNWYHYIVWLIVGIAVVSITIHTLLGGEPSRMASGVALIFCIVVLFALVRWFFNKLA